MNNDKNLKKLLNEKENYIKGIVETIKQIVGE